MILAMFSPIIRKTWLYLQHLVMFTNVAAGWCHLWVGTEWVGERERSVLFNDADSCEVYVALMWGEWNMSWDSVELYMTGETEVKVKVKFTL